MSQIGKLILSMIHFKGERKIATSTTSARGRSTQQKQVNKIMEEYMDIFTLPTRVPLHYQVKHSIDLIPSVPLPSGLVYR